MAEAVLEVALGNLSSLIGKELELYLGLGVWEGAKWVAEVQDGTCPHTRCSRTVVMKTSTIKRTVIFEEALSFKLLNLQQLSHPLHNSQQKPYGEVSRSFVVRWKDELEPT
ncbi:hypothetical protein JHK85_000697 [Glycine max]|nr:hypothetical protein JHK85_000697 [Glycine max]